MSVSVAIVHHPSRKELLAELILGLGQNAKPYVSTEDGRGPVETTRGAWKAYVPECSHHLIMEDDTFPAFGMLSAVEAAARQLGPFPFSLFGIRRELNRAFEEGYSWVKDTGTNWAQALCVPTVMIPDFLAWEQEHVRPEFKWFCQRLSLYCSMHGLPVYNTIPCLVEHVAPDASLVGNPTKAGGRHDRVAACFLPDAKALDDDYWAGPIKDSPSWKPTDPRQWAAW